MWWWIAIAIIAIVFTLIALFLSGSGLDDKDGEIASEDDDEEPVVKIWNEDDDIDVNKITERKEDYDDMKV